ncbi:hypothetical protein SLE2022_143230 [Rubroshorea leprosula]
MSFANPSGYDKFSTTPPPPPPPSSVPPPYFSQSTTTGTSTTGVPLSSTSSYSYAESPKNNLRLRPKTRVPWSSGLFGCFSDWKNCCITFWCPCITFGRIAEIVDKGSSSCGVNGALYTLICCVTCGSCCYSCFYRAKLRQQFLLEKTPCGDCPVHCFCECCALCQEYRELKSHGYDLKIGWHGNMERQNREVAMTPVTSTAPIVEGGMYR